MENSNNNVPDYPPVSKNGIGSSFPSRKTVTVLTCIFRLFIGTTISAILPFP